MKFLATILTIHILFLTVSPAFPDLFVASEKSECTEPSCCAKEETSDTACPTNKNCGMAVCNPFMVCCSCNAVVSQKQTISIPVCCSGKKQFSIVSGNGCDFTTEAWNPPKTI